MANLNLHHGIARLRVIAADVDRKDDGEIHFRRYRLLPRSRMLLRDGRPLDLGSRAFDLLHVLLSCRGTVVPKDDIVRRVWPATVVDDCNLRFQIAVLRKALGKDRDLIKTISGRGYLFVAEPEAVRFAQVEPEARHWGARVPADSADGADPRETLRVLLRSVLDELWEMTLQGQRLPEPSFSAGVNAVGSRLRR